MSSGAQGSDGGATQDAVRGDLDLVHRRVIAEPRRRVYRAMADPDRLPRWWGPAGFRTRTHAIELEPGGEWRVTLIGPDGSEFENVYRFVEMADAERFVVDHVTGHWFRLTVTLEDAPGGTQVTWQQTFPSRAERDALVAVCVPGNEQNLDKLEAFLASERG
jgi:uncharacterized protein YndB with AHSA1/START domain